MEDKKNQVLKHERQSEKYNYVRRAKLFSDPMQWITITSVSIFEEAEFSEKT